jgi:hypothetical protein
VRLIDPCRGRARAVSPIPGAGAASRRTSAPLPMGSAEWRRFAKARASRRVELILEALVAALQALPLALGTRQVIVQRRDLVLLALDQCGLAVRRRRAHIRHTLVMSDERGSDSTKHWTAAAHAPLESPDVVEIRWRPAAIQAERPSRIFSVSSFSAKKDDAEDYHDRQAKDGSVGVCWQAPRGAGW